MKILQPKTDNSSVQHAAEIFCDMYAKITGDTLEFCTEDDGDDLILIGDDSVNPVSARLFIEGKCAFRTVIGTDGYHIVSYKDGNRNLLILAGGRGRSTIYAVYRYFEKFCGCSYFWDGDRIPKAKKIPMENIELCEEPHFYYRGLRYFAHRGLHRFQAEQWGWSDWKREIDWMLKKRLNLFMLRIGNDDLFQKAFPDFVEYPSDNKNKSDKKGFDDRTTAWPLQYRGQLRKKILDYAFECDLMHPEDCGTMTHWYTPTPRDFLEHVKPEFFVQSTSGYAEEETLVWDIRQEKNMDNYIKLTETHVKEYGKGELFHTIGFAERMFSDDRDENFRMKLYVYRKIASYIRNKYPNSPLLLASWDLWYKYTPDEVKKLLNEMDPEHTVLLDYTSDTNKDNNFTKWDVIGKFPYIFGIFQAYCSNSGPLGRYDIIENRLEIASKDKFCKGMIFWPELSHGDSYMLSYFTENAWNPLQKNRMEFTEEFCKKRYGSYSDIMQKVYILFDPFIPLISWDDHQTELFCNVMWLIKWMEREKPGIIDSIYATAETMHNLSDNADEIFDLLSSIETNDIFVLRDMYDIARTVIGRYIHIGLHEVWMEMRSWKLGGVKPTKSVDLIEKCLRLLDVLEKILEQHDDYSLRKTYEKLFEETVVSPFFENTLKENATCEYNRTYVYEHVKYLYKPEMQLVKKWINESLDAGICLPDNLYSTEAEKVNEIYFNTPLSSIERNQYNRRDLFSDAANQIRKMF